ncbi:hypothetical protein [Criblamydia sequanensis]|uniref:DUF116 domain-containing protein n=1 Tax=Candidatus Criblamydia sequanensis CRIB-18 TaxID=1437425 RepID=A0A090D0C2_9BACT|nr:hypothetical protein [Criblamydia sequanensis]CDR33023.1 conserved hypothetical protein [Criblamydia sequanensis CRIB-18]
MTRLNLLSQKTTWEDFERSWDEREKEAEKELPLKKLKVLPDMVGITKETAKNLKWKSLLWMIRKDRGFRILRHFLKHPFKYGKQFLKSWRSGKPFKREGDYFLYGLNSLSDFESLLLDKEALFVVGFSYCHKPFECPSGRFSAGCIRDTTHNVCKQCFIGKTIHGLAKENSHPVLIPTVHHIGNELFDLLHEKPDRKIVFLITACEMTLEMFGDYGNMIGIQGIGVRLGGRICNTLQAFKLSEEGVKPGLTVVLDATKEKMLHWVRKRSEAMSG